MDFRVFARVATVVLISSCSAGSKIDDGRIGSPISEQAGLYNSYGLNSSVIFFVDLPSQRVMGVGLDDFAIKHQFSIKNRGPEQYVAIDLNEKFVVNFSNKHLDVYGLDGGVYPRPFSFQGTPQSVAYNPYTRVMVMQDDLSSVGILKFAENGAITKSWLGGPQIESNESIVAGDLDRSGRLVLSLTSGSISVVDIDQTLEKQSWQASTFSPDLGVIKWIAPLANQEDLVMVASATKIAVLNVATKTVLESKDLNTDAQYIKKSKAGRPHIYTRRTTGVELYLPNLAGTIEVETIRVDRLSNLSMDDLEQSYLDIDAGTITTLFSPARQSKSILRLRLSDGLVSVEKSLEVEGDASLNAAKLFVNYDDPLGACELHHLDSSEVKSLKGYNFDYFRNQK
jgi:hypothetical protein